MKKGFILLSLLFISILICTSCTNPSPLYGSWQSYTGDELELSTDGSFTSKVTYNNVETSLEGNWSQNENVLQFTANSTRFNSIWNIDGSLLQLTWPADIDGNTIVLFMYRLEAK